MAESKLIVGSVSMYINRKVLPYTKPDKKGIAHIVAIDRSDAQCRDYKVDSTRILCAGGVKGRNFIF